MVVLAVVCSLRFVSACASHNAMVITHLRRVPRSQSWPRSRPLPKRAIGGSEVQKSVCGLR